MHKGINGVLLKNEKQIIMEKFEKKEVRPMEKYIGRLARLDDGEFEVVGYNRNELEGEPVLIVDASKTGGWTALEPFDVIFKECESYWYASVSDLIN